VDEFRRVERQPQGDDPAGGMADDVGTLDAEVPQKGAARNRPRSWRKPSDRLDGARCETA
jgi:hypothetical protein